MLTSDLFTDARSGDGGRETLCLPDAELEIFRQFLKPGEASDWFEALMADGAVRWRQDHMTIYGRSIPIPRLNAWYGDPGLDYTYSGIPMDPEPWTELLARIRDRVQEAARASFTSVLINLYRDGRDSVAWHADDEPELGQDPVIASLSLGAEREFQMRHRNFRESGLPLFRLNLTPGSLLLMRGSTQRCWQHRIPKRTGRNAPGPRINLTFRKIRPDAR